MQNWKSLREFSHKEQMKLRWLLRFAETNGIIEAGVALKFGREWRVNTDALPGYLLDQTKKAFGKQAAA
jgi:hypothetical protein